MIEEWNWKECNFYKMIKKQLEIKTIKTELKNIIPSIWIEGLNWKPINFFTKEPRKKIEIKRIRNKLQKYNIW